jgi:hypothetical protein
LLPDETVRCGFGSGVYGSAAALSIGCAVKAKDRIFFNGGISTALVDQVFGALQGKFGMSIGWGGAPKSQKKQEPPAVLPSNQSNNSAATSTVETANLQQSTDQLRLRIQFLEDQLQRLLKQKPGSTESSVDGQIQLLKKLLAEKSAAEALLRDQLAQQQQAIKEQRIMLEQQQKTLDQLLRRLAVSQPPAQTSSLIQR